MTHSGHMCRWRHHARGVWQYSHWNSIDRPHENYSCRRDDQWESMFEPDPGRETPRDPLPGSAAWPAPQQRASSRAHVESGEDRGADLTELLLRSARGDEGAFAAFYDATASRVYGLTRRLTRSPELAAEVVQEVYLMAWQQAARFDPSRGSVTAWLSTLAHRRAVDRIRQVVQERGREQTYESRRVGAPMDATWQEVEQDMETRDVRTGLGALTSLQREAITLAYYNGCTYQEVAQRLDIPLGTAKARIRDGLKRLGAALGAQQ